MKGPLGMGHLFEEALWRGPQWGAPSLGTLEHMLRNSPDTDISLHGDPFPSEGNLVCGGDRKMGTLIDERRTALVVGHRSVRDFIKGTLREGSFTGEPER